MAHTGHYEFPFLLRQKIRSARCFLKQTLFSVLIPFTVVLMLFYTPYAALQHTLSLLLYAVIRCFLRNMNVMRMRFFEGCCRNLDKSSVFLQQINGRRSAISHTGS